jgi:hypothetical protein
MQIFETNIRMKGADRKWMLGSLHWRRHRRRHHKVRILMAGGAVVILGACGDETLKPRARNTPLATSPSANKVVTDSTSNYFSATSRAV